MVNEQVCFTFRRSVLILSMSPRFLYMHNCTLANCKQVCNFSYVCTPCKIQKNIQLYNHLLPGWHTTNQNFIASSLTQWNSLTSTERTGILFCPYIGTSRCKVNVLKFCKYSLCWWHYLHNKKMILYIRT